MILDWKNNKQEALKNGICEEQIFSVTRIIMKATEGVVAYCTFRNFDKLEFVVEQFVNLQDLTADRLYKTLAPCFVAK